MWGRLSGAVPGRVADPSAHGILARIFSEIIIPFPTHLCMTQPTEFGHTYRRKLPHYRTPGAIYHARFSIHSSLGLLKMDRDFLIVQNAILFWHKRRCMLIAYVVMPNHVHILLEPLASLRKITLGIKGASAREANRALRRTDKAFWQDESFDHWVRNGAQFERIRGYIEQNPVKAGLVATAEDWPWSSAHE